MEKLKCQKIKKFLKIFQKTLANFQKLYYNTKQVQQVNKLTTAMKRKLRGNLLGKIQVKISTDYQFDSPFIAEFQLTIWTTMKIINRLASYLSK